VIKQFIASAVKAATTDFPESRACPYRAYHRSTVDLHLHRASVAGRKELGTRVSFHALLLAFHPSERKMRNFEENRTAAKLLRQKEDAELVRANHELCVVLLQRAPGRLRHVGTGNEKPGEMLTIWRHPGVGLDVW